MTLYFIGIGLNDEKDISVKGLDIVKKAEFVYLENYTSKLNVPISFLEKFYGKRIMAAGRKLVEMEAEKTILEQAQKKDVAFLVVGDIFSATTHMDLYLRAKRAGIKTFIVHNVSVMTAVGVTGLQLYKFGKTASIPFENENVETPYDALKSNQKNELHTLFLLDLKEETNDSLSVNEAIRYLLKVEMKRGERVFNDSMLCVGCAKLGSLDQVIKAGKAKDLLKFNFGNGMQCLIVPAKKMHFMEEEALRLYF